MLKPEDCKPGTPIICIKYEGILSPISCSLIIDSEYSIKEFFPKGTIATGKGLWSGKVIPENTITLNEISPDNEGEDWCYMIEWFRLKYDPKALEIFKFKGIKATQRLLEKEDA